MGKKGKKTEPYPPELTALALGFTDYIFDSYYDSKGEDYCNQQLLKALERVGHRNIDITKLNQSIGYYMESSDVDLTGFDEYNVEFPQ